MKNSTYRFTLFIFCVFSLLSVLINTTAQAEDSLRDRIIQAGLPATPAERLKQLARDENPTVRAAIAGNRKSPAEVLIGLASDPDSHVRQTLALNIDAPEAAKLLMAKDNDTAVRLRLAKCGYMFPSVLKILARDKNVDVRRLTAKNFNATAEVLELMVNDEDEKVRSYVAGHEAVTPHFLFRSDPCRGNCFILIGCFYRRPLLYLHNLIRRNDAVYIEQDLDFGL